MTPPDHSNGFSAGERAIIRETARETAQEVVREAVPLIVEHTARQLIDAKIKSHIEKCPWGQRFTRAVYLGVGVGLGAGALSGSGVFIVLRTLLGG